MSTKDIVISEVFQRDVHNAIKLLLDNSFIISFNELELSKRIIGATEISYILLDDDETIAFNSADEALREMSHRVDIENKAQQSRMFVDVWNKD